MQSEVAVRAAENTGKVPVTTQRVCVFNLTRQSFLSFSVEVADTTWKRVRGLLGRLRLRTDDGVWVVPSQGIHTVGLMFPIDVVYLDAGSRVVHVVEHLKPFRLSPLKRTSRSVLELPARSVFHSDTQVGDQFIICSPEELASQLRPGQPESRIEGQRTTSGSNGTVAGTGTPSGERGTWFGRLFRTIGDRRRERRSAVTGVVAFYWDGGVPHPHCVRNLTTRGAFIAAAKTTWFTGTIIELTIQQQPGDGAGPQHPRTVQLSARVVRRNAEGVAVRFLYTAPAERTAVGRILSAAKEVRR